MYATNCIKLSWGSRWDFLPIAFSFATGDTGYHNQGNFTKWVVVLFLIGVALFDVAAAQSTAAIQGQALVAALREGGYNIYFRHAVADWSQSDQVSREGDWASCESSRMRQLSEGGRKTAHAIGETFRTLQIPIGAVFASPYCRTVQTASHMQLGPVETTTDIMNMRVAEYFGGRSAIAERTRQRLSMPPKAGTNTVLVTAAGVYPQEAEAIVFRPDGNGSYSFVARISPKEWMHLAAGYSDR